MDVTYFLDCVVCNYIPNTTFGVICDQTDMQYSICIPKYDVKTLIKEADRYIKT